MITTDARRGTALPTTRVVRAAGATLTVVQYHAKRDAVLAVCERAAATWTGDPFVPPGLLVCVKTRSTVDVLYAGIRNPGTEDSWDAQASFPAHITELGEHADLVRGAIFEYPMAGWYRQGHAERGSRAVLSWYQTAELPGPGGTEPAIVVLDRIYGEPPQPMCHVRAIDAGRRILVFDVWQRRLDAMRAYRRVQQGLRRQAIAITPGDTFPADEIPLGAPQERVG